MMPAAPGKAPPMPSHLRLRERIFEVPHHDAAAPPLAYLPLSGVLLELDAAGLALLGRLEAGVDAAQLAPEERRVVEQVAEMELLRLDRKSVV